MEKTSVVIITNFKIENYQIIEYHEINLLNIRTITP